MEALGCSEKTLEPTQIKGFCLRGTVFGHIFPRKTFMIWDCGANPEALCNYTVSKKALISQKRNLAPQSSKSCHVLSHFPPIDSSPILLWYFWGSLGRAPPNTTLRATGSALYSAAYLEAQYSLFGNRMHIYIYTNRCIHNT